MVVAALPLHWGGCPPSSAHTGELWVGACGRRHSAQSYQPHLRPEAPEGGKAEPAGWGMGRDRLHPLHTPCPPAWQVPVPTETRVWKALVTDRARASWGRCGGRHGQAGFPLPIHQAQQPGLSPVSSHFPFPPLVSHVGATESGGNVVGWPEPLSPSVHV